MKIPNATYRIQFGPAFTFKDAHKIVDYLAALGVHWIYASPIFKARRGSLHGYDVTDTNRLNPEIGSRSDFSRLQQALRRHGMGWLQDTVPNHMAYSGENPLLADLFALDEKAVSDGYFDIWWSGAGPAGRRRLAAPFLGDSLAACLEKKEIRPVLRQGILGVQYYAHFFPLRLESYGILTPPPGILNARSSSAWPASAAYAPLSDIVATLQRCAARPFSAARDDRIAKAREKLHALMENRPDIRAWVHRCLENYDPVHGGADAADALKKLLGAQVFELRWWQTAARDINYRRFFDINELISLRQELPSVFEHTHRGLRTLLQKGLIDGLRVDHVDGLRDPAAYLRSLRRVCGGIYLVVEKILGPRETLPPSWPVQGTTGYEFADRLTRLFCRADRQNALDRICRAFTGREDSFETVCCAARRQVLAECFGGELAHLVQLTQKSAAASYAAPAGGRAALRRALRQLLIRFPVYRTYAAGGAADQGDAALIQSVAEAAAHRHPRRAPALAFVRDCLVGNGPHAARGSPPNADCEEIAARFQQLCAPLAAKGVEDTALYRYPRLTALNEVGGDPRRVGISRAAFHAFAAQRAADWPQAMNGLSSHDSKRPSNAFGGRGVHKLSRGSAGGGKRPMSIRKSGILLHPTSLPGRFGIGDLGPAAYHFVDLLVHMGQQYWQVLPLSPTAAAHGHSPYHSTSAFAGEPLWISPRKLLEQDWLEPADLSAVPTFSAQQINFPKVIAFKETLLEKAFARFEDGKQRAAVARFARRNAWLRDAALFQVLERQFGAPWPQWPSPLRDRRPSALEEACHRFRLELRRAVFRQYLFFDQWRTLKRYANRRGVHIIGDLPIYLPFHSADVWCHPEGYKLRDDRTPSAVSGVPPDYFSETGQRWGHPLYDWRVQAQTGFQWWKRRIEHNLKQFDRIRIDHFRGWIACWEVPAEAATAVDGKWSPAPGVQLLEALERRFPCLPLIAEDLGTIDADVREAMARFHLPGMRVLLFAFGDDFPHGAFLPHQYPRNTVVYTGTHDNNTVRGWYRTEAGAAVRARLAQYLGRRPAQDAVHWDMIRLALGSVADTVVIPLQDILGLDETARMNHPGRLGRHWRWRAPPDLLPPDVVRRMAALTHTYGRFPARERLEAIATGRASIQR